MSRISIQSPLRMTASWTIATTIGYALGGAVIVLLASILFGGVLNATLDLAEIESGSTRIIKNLGGIAVMGLGFGLVVSACQWLILRQLRKDAAHWLIFCALGTSLAFVIAPLICLPIMTNLTTFRLGCQGPSYNPLVNSLEFNPLLTGAMVGVAQWLYLRRWLPYAGLWIPATAVSGYLLVFSYNLSFGAIMSLVCAVGIPTFLAVPSFVNGLTIGWLWRKKEESEAFIESLV